MSEVIHEMPFADYLARSEFSMSDLETARKSTRLLHYRRAFPDDTSSPAAELGTLIHARLLTPEIYEDIHTAPSPEVAPDGKKWLRRKGSDHARWWQEWLDSIGGRIVVDLKTLRKIDKIHEQLSQSGTVQRLMESGHAEVSCFWTCERTGLPLKARFDWVGEDVAFDLKCHDKVSPTAFARECVKWGYHRRLAHYRAASRACLDCQHLIFVAASTSQPYQVAAYDLDDRDADGVAIGRRQYHDALSLVANCLKTGEWSDAWESSVNEIKLPAFAQYEDEYQLATEELTNVE